LRIVGRRLVSVRLLCLCASIAATALALDARLPAHAAVASAQGVAVPAYFDPGSAWTRVDASTPAVRLAIVNPDNGPGSARDGGFARTVSAAQAAGISVLGYVYTNSARRPLSVVEANIDAYYRWYGVDGIFFDEASTSCAREPYYAALNAYVKAKGGAATTVLNPGTATSECYTAAADILVTFEDSYRNYVHAYSAPAWVAHYPPNRFWQIVYGAPNATAMAEAVRLSKARGAGYVYVTPERLPNPYAGLPKGAYWQEELADVGAG
jgi:hypothetical protein